MIQIDKILSIPFDKITGKNSLTPKEKRLILDSFYEATGERRQEGCGQCFIEMYLYFRKNKDFLIHKIMGNSKFRIKDNRVITNHKFDIVLTPANLTDQLAIEFLKRVPGGIGYFSEYPENWQSLVSGKEIKAKPVVIDEPINDAPLQDLAAEAIERKKKKAKE